MTNDNYVPNSSFPVLPSQYQSEIEEFVASKNPKSAADVEHWIQVFNYGQADAK